jgi:hypothetical protein
MTAIRSCRRSARRLLVTIALMSTGAAIAEETIDSSGLSAQACTQKDTNTTQFCEALAGDLLSECLATRDRMLGSCVATGRWSDALEVDPRTGAGPDGTGRLAALLLRMLMISGDSNGDGALPPDEIGALKTRVLADAAAAPPQIVTR